MIAPAHSSPSPSSALMFDRLLHAAATEVLANSKYTPIRQLTCQVAQGVVELAGTVPSFYLKQLAQAALLQLEPSCQIHNRVVVADSWLTPEAP